MTINTAGINVGSDGKVTFSGASSGIDSKAIIDAAVKARRIPAVKLEAKITANNDKVAALQEFKTKVKTLTTTLNDLRGNPSFLSDDVFKRRSASGFTSAGPSAPVGYTPSDIGSLLTVNVDKTAQVATHRITVHEIAKAQQFRSGSFASTSATLVSQGVTAGTFTIGTETVTIDADDTLQDLRSKINDSDAGVTATIVSAGSTTHYLVVTANKTGVANAVSFGAGTATSDTIGFTSGGAIQFELQAAQNAELDVDGITGIERASNDIDDIITGVTLSLLKSETNTEITLKVEPDLVSIKSAISDLVTSYNDIRAFYDDQRTASDRNNDGTIDDNELGPLAYNNMLRTVIDKLGQISAFSNDDNTDGFQSLGQIGITVSQDYKLQLDETIFDSKLLTNVDALRRLFVFDFQSNDSRLSYLGRTDNTQAGTYYLNIAGTDASGNVVTANLQSAAVVGNGGLNDGSITVSNKLLTITDESHAEDLQLFFNGPASLGNVNDIQVSFTRGVADSFFDYFDQLTKLSGDIDTDILALNDTSADYQTNIDTIDTRIDTYRESLVRRYTAMETALARLESLKKSLTSYFDAQNSSSN